MFGAFLDDNEKVVFTNDTEGRDTFYRLFLQGHAVKIITFLFHLIAAEIIKRDRSTYSWLWGSF
jgi:hypothetical protein